MKTIKNIVEIPESNSLYITIGNFDGVHYGHSKILDHVRKASSEENGTFVVVTFVPHPLLLLRPRHNYLLNTYDERRELLSKEGIDYLIEIEFGRDFSNLGPKLFLDNYILKGRHSKKLFLGHDFAFGAGKEGNYNSALEYCGKKGVAVNLLPKFDFEGKCVSSSVVRQNLTDGNIEYVNSLLKRKFFLNGMVVKGKERGASIGFPTANISYSEQRMTPCRGVYITTTKIGKKVYHSVTNIGYNPTFEEDQNLNVETHILGFDELIYGENICVLFYKKLRNERKFNSVNELVVQIKKDVLEAESFFKAGNA